MRRLRLFTAFTPLLLVSCMRDDRSAIPLVVIHRLVEEHAGGAGITELPSVAIGGTTRPVLVGPTISLMGPKVPPLPTVPESERAGLLLACPETGPGGSPFALSVNTTRGFVTLPGAYRCTSAQAPVVVELRDKPGAPSPRLGKATVPPASGPVTTEWLDLPRGARLQLALGLADPRPLSTIQAVRFRVTAENPAATTDVVGEWELDPRTRTGDADWREVDLPFAPVIRKLGARVRLVFETERIGDGVMDFGVWGDPRIVAPASDEDVHRRNVILVSLDTLRADQLGAYGNARHASPFLDALATRSALFETAVTAAPHTFPSHATMFTGLEPCAHGLGFGASTLLFQFPKRVQPIAELLRNVGYTTVAFTEDAVLDPAIFHRGFDLFQAEASFGAGASANATQTFARARSWLRDHHGERFFLLVHTYQVHEPYDPPVAFRHFFDVDDGWVDPVPHRSYERANVLALYDADLRYTDGVVAGLLDDLAALGLEQNTIVLVTSDHGQGIGEHGVVGHGDKVFDEALRVPMLWYAPGLIPPGRHGGGVVGLVDVAPTLLELLDVPAPYPLQGRSLAATLTAAAPLDPARVLFSRGLSDRSPSSVRGVGWKVIVERAGAARYYNLEADPIEQAPEANDEAVRGTELLRAHERECAELHKEFAAAAPPPAVVPDPDRDRKLRALGYVE